MRDKPLISVTVITDDDTGMYTVGELDFGIHGDLTTYLEKDPIRRRDNVLAMMGYLQHCVCLEAERLHHKDMQDPSCSAQAGKEG